MSNAETKEHFCEQCNVRIYGVTPWQQHLESRGHRRKEKFEDQFALNTEDMFLDDDATTAKMLKDIRSLIGLEHIVEDRTNNEVKCMLCRVLLKDKANIIDHLRSYKHQFSYLENIDPNLTRSLQQKPLKKNELQQAVQKQCDELLKQFGRQKIRVYEEGYYMQRRLKLAEQRTRQSGTIGPDNVNVEDLEELPKDTKVMQVLLSSELERFPGDETSYINNVMKDLPGPVLGLEYVAEYSDPSNEYEPGYLCTLCESIMNSAQLVLHIVKKEHRLKYIERDFGNFYKIITFSGFNEERRNNLIQNYSNDIEKTQGRGLISLRLKLPKNCDFLFRYHRRIGIRMPDRATVNQQSMAKATFDVKVIPPSTAAFLQGEGDDESGANRRSYGPPQVSSAVPFPVSGVPKVSNVVSFVPKPPPQMTVVGFSSAPSVEMPIYPKKPNFIYSQREEEERKMFELEKLVPPYAQRNIQSGWFSERSKSWEFYNSQNPGAPYCSLRCPNARRTPYGDWSPHLMRRLQDQFNFDLSHLAWLQDNFRRWRTPLYQPLEIVDLRPLEEEVESAVLQVLVGNSLKPVAKERRIFDYRQDFRPLTQRLLPEIIDYTNDPAGVKVIPEAEIQKADIDTGVEDNHQLQKQPEPMEIAKPSDPGSTSANWLASFIVSKFGSAPKSDENRASTPAAPGSGSTSAPPTATPTPNENNRPKSAAEQAILDLSEQILATAQNSSKKNVVLQLLLSYKNAKTILYHLATKEPLTLQQIITIIKNPDNAVASEGLIELQSKFDAFSKL